MLGTLGTYSNLNKGTAGVYSQKAFSMASWRGQTVRLQVQAGERCHTSDHIPRG